jgi:hypothetical protein
LSPYFSSTWTELLLPSSLFLSLSFALLLSPLTSLQPELTAHPPYPYLLLYSCPLYLPPEPLLTLIFCSSLSPYISSAQTFSPLVYSFLGGKRKKKRRGGGWLSSLGHESEICPYF